MVDSKIKVVELFAGVGGFHLGLKRASKAFDVVWADQYEPGRKNQFAFNIYKNNFPTTNVVNDDISKVDKKLIPDFDLLVGGFPCQDYSVATSGAKGLYGKKGVLWWDIRDVIKEKWPKFIFLENVDRLLASPGVSSNQPGRDFGMILRTLSDLGYGVTWKMINAADYGFPQRRRRIFIFAARQDTSFRSELQTFSRATSNQLVGIMMEMKPFSSSLKNEKIDKIETVNLNKYGELKSFSDNFRVNKGFKKIGFMVDGKVFMANYIAKTRKPTTLGDIIEPNNSNTSLYLTNEMEEKFKNLKKGFNTVKISKTGYKYKYGMGGMSFPDSLDKPARTMVTSEHTISRMSHVIKDPETKKLRLISPEEAEKINTFPKYWTKLDGVSESNRYFTMGNALVVDLVKEIAEEIVEIDKHENKNREIFSYKKVDSINH